MLCDRLFSTLSYHGFGRASFVVQYILGSVIRILWAFAQRLPSLLAAWTVSLAKLLFIAMVGFTAWVNSFPAEQFSATFSFAVLCISAAYSSYIYLRGDQSDILGRKIASWDQDIKSIRDKWASSDEEINTITMKSPGRTIDNTVPYHKGQSDTKAMRDLLSKLTERNKELETEIHERKKDAIIASKNFRRKLDEMETVVKSMKFIEKNKKSTETQLQTEYEVNDQLQKDVVMLQETIQSLNKQNRHLMDKNAEVTRDMKILNSENNRLRMQITEQVSRDEEEYISDVQQIAQRLQTSLSSAKGKLSRVGDFLKNDDAVIIQRTYKRMPSDSTP